MTSDRYDNPLISRYASPEMATLWGPRRKFTTWRRLWLILAEEQQRLGLPIRDDQLEQMRQHLDDIDLAAAERYEARLRHDVMAHVHAFGDQCPAARPIIHLGATSCYVTDNTDLIVMREALQLVQRRLFAVIDAWARFADRHRDLACLALTHLQPAQPTTVGKRACLWAHDLVLDLEESQRRVTGLRARSIQGTTGTQASFLQLLGGNHQSVRLLEQRVARRIGFEHTYAVTGQTYSRKVDCQVLDCLSGIAQSAHKTATDLRLLIARKELDEPFEPDQIGSSAMAYKRNPMRCERICSLARYATSLPSALAQTASTQWLERTLDDSALRRIAIPQAFLAVDSVLVLLRNVSEGLVVYPQVIERNLKEELPFLATEAILMAAVTAGGDRQALHERIRQHSQAAGAQVKQHGTANDLLLRLQADPAFAGLDWEPLLDARQFVGRAPQQVDEFLTEVIAPLREQFGQAAGDDGGVRV